MTKAGFLFLVFLAFSAYGMMAAFRDVKHVWARALMAIAGAALVIWGMCP